MEKAALILMSREPVRAGQFIREKEQINIQARLSRKARLEKPLAVQSAPANVLDMIDCLRRINSHLTSLGYAIVRNVPRSGQAEGNITHIEEKEISPAEFEPKRDEKRALLDDR